MKQDSLKNTDNQSIETPQIISTSLITEFKGEYGFVNKRLPVVKVAYQTSDKLRLYVEPATGRMAAQIVDNQAFAGFLFAYLHKYHFLDTFGKDVRDIATMIFAFGNFLLACLGLKMLIGRRLSSKKSSN